MKRTLHSICIIAVFTLSSTNLIAQISLLSTDLTAIGDQITRHGDTIPAYGPGGSGANQTWDFSSAINDTTTITSVTDAALTPYATTFSGSDYAMSTNANTSSFLFFEHNASQFITTGAAGDLLGTGEMIEAPFVDPLKLHEFPRTYQSFFDDTYAFQAEADGAAFNVHRIRLSHSGHVYDTTDAYGTLITPTGTYDAIRVKSTDYTTDVIDVQLSPLFPAWVNFTTVSDTSVTYSWHAKEEMLAIAEFTFDSLGNPRQFTYSAVPPVTTVGIDVDEEISVTIYPQPASNILFVKGLSQSGNNHAEIFSIDGKLVSKELLTGTSINVSGLKSGMYILRFTTSDGLLAEPIKFIVQH